MLQGLGRGLVGVALAPRARAAELTSSPQTLFSCSDGTSTASAVVLALDTAADLKTT